MKPIVARSLRSCAQTGRPLDPHVALAVLQSAPDDLPEIMACAWRLRTRRFGRSVRLCSILNARSGACAEDCAFCAQSARHAARAPLYPLRSLARIVRAMEDAARNPIDYFGVVTSGNTLNPRGVARVCRAVASRKRLRVAWCASLGSLETPELEALQRAGLKRYHHNLETAPGFFPNVCATHSFDARLATLRRARAAGLEVCSGGILGMGESLEQRVELALALRNEEVASIPLNFLVPIPGTPLANAVPMRPLDILRAVAMFRMTNPRAEIKVCAGRRHFRSLESMLFYAGATGIMIGNLLTVPGQDIERDLQMIEDLGLEAVPPP